MYSNSQTEQYDLARPRQAIRIGMDISGHGYRALMCSVRVQFQCPARVPVVGYLVQLFLEHKDVA